MSEDSTKGGLLVGLTDKSNGAGIDVIAPEGKIKMGGGEIIINEKSSTKHCELLSEINQDGGGVAIPCDIQPHANTGKFDGGGKLNPEDAELNSKGGYNYSGPAKYTAQKVGLITLPKSIAGTNCSSCVFFSSDYCHHKAIQLPVTSRQCCSLWDSKTSVKSWIEGADKVVFGKKKGPDYSLNDRGGFEYHGEGLERAKNVDLITLPEKILGTNCGVGNCRFNDGKNNCINKNVLLPVTDRMSCSLWDNEEVIRPWREMKEVFFKVGGRVSVKEKMQNKKNLYLQLGEKIAQGYVITSYANLKKILGKPNIKNKKDKIGWYMAFDANHIGAVWTESDKPLKEIMKEKFHKWFIWTANPESEKRLHDALKLQVRDIDPVKQKEKDKAISEKRWEKKREHIHEMSNNIQKIKVNVSRDLNSEDEKEFLTALVVAVMLQTSERVGNEESMDNGHFGCTGFKKEHVKVIGNKVLLDYVGKSGVEHEKSFTDKRIAKALKKAIKNSPSEFVFETSDGFRIKCDKVTRYLQKYSVTPKNIRGFNANKGIIKKLEAVNIPESEKERKKILNSAIKKTALEVGHGASTLKKHYMIPELPTEYVNNGRIIDMKNLGYYYQGGAVNRFENAGKLGDLSADKYFLNKNEIPEIVNKKADELYKLAEENDEGIVGVFDKCPVIEIDFKDIVPTQDFLRSDKLEGFGSVGNWDSIRLPHFIGYDGKFYAMDGHHRIVSKHLKNIPIKGHVCEAGIKDDGGKLEAKKLAEEFVSKLSEGDFKDLKDKFNELVDEILIEQQKKLDELIAKKSELEKERDALYEQEKGLPYGEEKTKLGERRREIRTLTDSLDLQIRHYQNIVKVISNGGELVTFTDKKGTEHKDIPYFVRIKTDMISFDEETILTDAVPPYIPFIDEEEFRKKGYVFDAIRIAPDQYILAVNGYNETKGGESYYRSSEPKESYHPSPSEQGYLIVTLDQLALINDYYFTKARAVERKRADDRNLATEKYYDSLSEERRAGYLNQKGFYHSLPVAVKKKITQEEYEALSIAEKEKLYKPFKRAGVKRLITKLHDNSMWVSFHEMYERFLNPNALPINKQGEPIKSGQSRVGAFGNKETFAYWYEFRDMMKWKMKDIQVQREADSEIRKIALETSFGESNTNDTLKEEYGILVKRQNGTPILPNEIEQIKNAWIKIQSTFGTLSNKARKDNLKISHTGIKYVFASKSAGVFIPTMKTIAVSNKFGDNQFEQIMSHEIAHWIDFGIGSLSGKRYACDDFESSSGIIARTFRKNMNQVSDSDYINATKECFARAMEQYFAFENFGEEATLIYSINKVDTIRTYHSEENYVSKEKFNTEIKPLIKQFLSEQESFFKYSVEVENPQSMGSGGKMRYNNGGKLPSPIQFKEKIEKETGLKVSMKKGALGSSMRGYMMFAPRKKGDIYPTFDFEYARALKEKMSGSDAYPNFFSVDKFSIYYGNEIYNEPEVEDDSKKLGHSKTIEEAKEVMFPLYEQLDKFEGDIKIGHTKIDWGAKSRGQGRRSGHMIKGSMSDAPRGIKSYAYVDWSMYPEVAEDIAHMKHFHPWQAERYVKARQFGANHLEAKLYALRNEPKANGGLIAPVSIRDTIIYPEEFEKLNDVDKKRMLELIDEFNKLGYIDVRTQLGPSQSARMSEKQREQIGNTQLKVFRIEDEIKEILKSPEQKTKEQLEKEKERLLSRKLQLDRQLTDLKRIYAKVLESPRDNKYKKTVRIAEEELNEINNKLQTLN